MADDSYWGDTLYEVWRRGGDYDAVDRDRVEQCERDGLYYDEAASIELRHQRQSNPMEDEYGGCGGPEW